MSRSDNRSPRGAERLDFLQELSRRPHACPHATPAVLTARLLRASLPTERAQSLLVLSCSATLAVTHPAPAGVSLRAIRRRGPSRLAVASPPVAAAESVARAAAVPAKAQPASEPRGHSSVAADSAFPSKLPAPSHARPHSGSSLAPSRAARRSTTWLGRRGKLLRRVPSILRSRRRPRTRRMSSYGGS